MNSSKFKTWRITVKIGNRVTVWTIQAPTKQSAHAHATLQLRHQGGNGTVVKVEEA
jgi:hypothetical protein